MCSYPLCSKECGEGTLHGQECEVLAKKEVGGQLGGLIIEVIRLLNVREHGGRVWDQIGGLGVSFYCCDYL